MNTEIATGTGTAVVTKPEPQKPGKRFYISDDKDKKVIRYLLVSEWKEAAKVEMSNRTYKRKKGRLERHRIIGLTPEFTTGGAGTDICTRPDPQDENKDIEIVHCIPRVTIEKFKIEEVKMGEQTQKIRVPLSSWRVDALDFLEDYEPYPEDD